MKCILMNKNTEVLLAEYESGIGVLTKIIEVYDINNNPLKTNLKEFIYYVYYSMDKLIECK